MHDEISSVAAELSIPMRILRQQEASKLLDELQLRYGTSNIRSYPLWEDLRSCESVRNPNGWAYVDSFFGQGPVVLLIEGDVSLGYIFEKSSEVKELLSNSTGFEFYVTNPDKSSLVVFNDHDVLIMCGNARGKGLFHAMPESAN